MCRGILGLTLLLLLAGCCCVKREVTPREAPQARTVRPAIDRVLAVDGETVVIGRGAAHGLGRGAQFVVYRSGYYVAIVKVVEVREEQAVARVLAPYAEFEVRPGDGITNDVDTAPRPIGIAPYYLDHPEARGPFSSWDCPGMPGPPPPPQVLAVDDEANVYVISVGAEHGVERGDRFELWRDGDLRGVLEIDTVQARQAAGHRVGATPRLPVARGDEARPAPSPRQP